MSEVLTYFTEAELNKIDDEVRKNLEGYTDEICLGLACHDISLPVKNLLVKMAVGNMMEKLKARKLERILL